MENPKIDLSIIKIHPLFAELDIDSDRGGPKGPDIEKGPLEGGQRVGKFGPDIFG